LALSRQGKKLLKTQPNVLEIEKALKQKLLNKERGGGKGNLGLCSYAAPSKIYSKRRSPFLASFVLFSL